MVSENTKYDGDKDDIKRTESRKIKKVSRKPSHTVLFEALVFRIVVLDDDPKIKR